MSVNEIGGDIVLAISDVGGDGYVVEYSTDGTNYIGMIGATKNDTTGVWDARLSAPVPGATYRFRASARHQDYSAYSVVQTVTTAPIAPPSNLRAGTADLEGYTTISWDDNSDNETGFTIESAVAGSPYELICNVPANTTSWYGGLAYNTISERFYRVRAFATTRDRAEVSYSNYSNIASSIGGTVEINADRTGLRFGQAVAESVQQSGDPAT
jgi:hypothetical protein